MDYLPNIGITPCLIGVGIACFFLYWKRFRSNHLWKCQGVPCEDPIPLIGNDLGLFLGKTFFELDSEWYKKHGRIYGVYTGSTPVLCVADPDVVKRVLVKDFHVLCDRRDLKSPNDILNSFVSILKGDEWKRVRSVITPAFSSGKLKKMIKLILDCGETTNTNLTKYAETGETVDCKKLFGSFTLDVIASAAFGTKLNSHQDPDNVFVQQAKKIFGVEFSWRLLFAFIFPKLALWLKISPISDEVTDFFKDLSLNILKRRSDNNEVRDDFLNSLMEAQKNKKDLEDIETKDVNENDHCHAEVDSEQKVNNEFYFKGYLKNKTISSTELVSQCVLFFLAGYETTATTLSLITYHLALNKEIQSRVVQEVDEVLKKHKIIDSEALNDMKYTEAAIYESLRLCPPATRLERLATEDYAISDLKIPKGTIIGVPIYAMHRDPEFFPNPETFDPERFLPENKDTIQPYTFLPFGAGPRNCLGLRFALMEIKLGLLQIYKNFTFQVCSSTLVPMQFMKGTALFQPKSVMLRVVKRKMYQ